VTGVDYFRNESNEQKHRLHILSSDGGTVYGVDDGDNFEYYKNAFLSACPSSGHYFKRWSNGEITNPISVSLTTDVEISAVFSDE